MTAEVAVLNRSAVALAADSAVTLSGMNPASEVTKVFQNENKLFELSKVFPVALMIYNATSFFEVPWEVIIKDFRKEEGDAPSENIFDWAERFRDYVSNHPIFKPTVGQQKDFVKTILFNEFGRVLSTFLGDTRELIFQKQTPRIKRRYNEIFAEILNDRIAIIESTDFYFEYTDEKASELLEAYTEEFDSARSEIFDDMGFSDSDQELLRRLAKAVLSRARSDWFTTGLVFAGFGTKELFPSLICWELGGAVNGALRWNETRRVDIDRSGSTAEIIPFAQREIVDTILFGRAVRYERRVVEYFTKSARQVGESLIKELAGGKLKRVDYLSRLDAAVKGIVTKFYENGEELKMAFARDTLDSVRHMPKPDLAAFAESLVTVTSMMRKASIGPETVGGPIDVAIISRHEGFVWVKRKHYFDAKLNMRYTWRAFDRAKGGENGAEQ
jgi:hypothetical protein